MLLLIYEMPSGIASNNECYSNYFNHAFIDQYSQPWARIEQSLVAKMSNCLFDENQLTRLSRNNAVQYYEEKPYLNTARYQRSTLNVYIFEPNIYQEVVKNVFYSFSYNRLYEDKNNLHSKVEELIASKYLKQNWSK